MGIQDTNATGQLIDVSEASRHKVEGRGVTALDDILGELLGPSHEEAHTAGCDAMLIDVSGLTLSQLESLPESSIAPTLREVLDPARGEVAAAGFDSFAPPPAPAR